MKRDWFCPCLLFFIGAIWLAVSAYFSVTAWIHLDETKRNYVKGICTVANANATVCTVVKDGSTVSRCQVAINVFRNVSFPNVPQASVGTPFVAVQLPKGGRGCVFENCLKARLWRDENFANDRTTCWVKRGDGKSPAILIANPDGNAKRDSIMFTAFACVAVLMVVSMIIVMCGLLCARQG